MFKLWIPVTLLAYSVSALFCTCDDILTDTHKTIMDPLTQNTPITNIDPPNPTKAPYKPQLETVNSSDITNPTSRTIIESEIANYTCSIHPESYEGTDIQLITSITDTITNCNLLTQNERQYQSLLLELEKQDNQLVNTVNQAIHTLDNNLKNNLGKELEKALKFFNKKIFEPSPNNNLARLKACSHVQECETGKNFYDRLKKLLKDAFKRKNLKASERASSDRYQTEDEISRLCDDGIECIFNVIRQKINMYIVGRTQLLLLKNHTFNMIVKELLYDLTCLKEIYTSQCHDNNLKAAALNAFIMLTREISISLRDLSETNYEWYTNMMTNRLELDIIEGISAVLNKPQVTSKMIQTIYILQNTIGRIVANFEKTIKNTGSVIQYHRMIDKIIGECIVKLNRYIANLIQELQSNVTAQKTSSVQVSKMVEEYKMLHTSRLIDSARLQLSLNSTLGCARLNHSPATNPKKTNCGTDNNQDIMNEIQNLIHEDIKTSEQRMAEHEESLERMQAIIHVETGNKEKAILDEITNFREKIKTEGVVSFFERILDFLYHKQPEMSNPMWSYLRSLLIRHEVGLFNKDIYTFLPSLYSYIEYFIR